MQRNTDGNSLCVLIPTYNRSNAVSYYLENKLNIFTQAHFDVVIYDSSPNELTQNVVKKYMENGYEGLKYVKYKDPAGDIYGTKKSRDALVECADNYEYVWLCGDTTILLLEQFQDELFELLQKGYDVIHIFENKEGLSSECDMDYKRFFKYFFWSMTQWCSFILSKHFIRKMDKWMTKYLAMNCTTILPFTIYATLPDDNYKIAYINHKVFKYSPYRTSDISTSSKDKLRGFAEVENVGIDNLPKEYDGIKSVTKKTFGRNSEVFTWQSAIFYRTDGNITFKKMLTYGKHLRHVTDVPIAWFYFWSLMPKRIAKKCSSAYIINIEGTRKLQEINENNGKLLLYGAGEHGIRILEKIECIYKDINVTAISDKNWDKLKHRYPVIPPSDICKYPRDYIGITIADNKIYKDVRRELIKMGISAKQIFRV